MTYEIKKDSHLKRILIISFSTLRMDPRVLRQIESIKKNYSVTVIGYGSPNVHVDHEIHVPIYKRNGWEKLRDGFLMLLGLHKIYYWFFNPEYKYVKRVIKDQKFDLIISNDFEALPIALEIAKETPVFLDAHEYTPDEIDNNSLKFYPINKYKKWLVRNYILKAQVISTVSCGIAVKYADNYDVPMPIVLPNMPRFANLIPTVGNKNKIKLVHHGIAHNARGIDILIQSMDFLDDIFELHLVLLGDQLSINYFKEIAKLNSRVFFHEPVETTKIPFFLNQFDIGVHFSQPVSESYRLGLPNKLFEFVQARLGVIVSPSPEMARYVKEYKFGLVSDGFDLKHLVEEIRTLDRAKVQDLKNAAHQSATKLCWETFEPDLLNIISTNLDKSKKEFRME